MRITLLSTGIAITIKVMVNSAIMENNKKFCHGSRGNRNMYV